MDYEKILRAYILHVWQTEGCDFITRGGDWNRPEALNRLADDERAALTKIAEEIAAMPTIWPGPPPS